MVEGDISGGAVSLQLCVETSLLLDLGQYLRRSTEERANLAEGAGAGGLAQHGGRKVRGGGETAMKRGFALQIPCGYRSSVDIDRVWI